MSRTKTLKQMVCVKCTFSKIKDELSSNKRTELLRFRNEERIKNILVDEDIFCETWYRLDELRNEAIFATIEWHIITRSRGSKNNACAKRSGVTRAQKFVSFLFFFGLIQQFSTQHDKNFVKRLSGFSTFFVR